MPDVTSSDRPDDRRPGFRTRAVHAGGRPDPATGARAVPIYQTSAYVFGDTEEAANLFALQTYGNIYSRISNPTVAAFEERIASLEGGLGAIGTASGQSAEFLTLASLAGAGDHIVSSAQLYGGTRTLMEVTLGRFGVETTFLASPEPDEVAAAIGPTTRAVYVEIVANPSGMIPDLEGLADVAHSNDIPLIVDSTMATPYLCRPIEFGADIVLHSVTKFIGGHGTSLGGAIVESGTFPWVFGYEENIHCIQEVAIPKAPGKTLCLAQKSTRRHLILGISLADEEKVRVGHVFENSGRGADDVLLSLALVQLAHQHN